MRYGSSLRRLTIAYNNFAQTLAEKKRYPEALALANQAILFGGPEQDAAKNSPDQIRNKMRK